MAASDPPSERDEVVDPDDPDGFSQLIPRVSRTGPQPTQIFEPPYVLAFDDPTGWRCEVVAENSPDRPTRYFFRPEQLTARRSTNPEHADSWYLVASGWQSAREIALTDGNNHIIYYRQGGDNPGWLLQIMRDVEAMTGMICEVVNTHYDRWREGIIRFRPRERRY